MDEKLRQELLFLREKAKRMQARASRFARFDREWGIEARNCMELTRRLDLALGQAPWQGKTPDSLIATTPKDEPAKKRGRKKKVSA